MENNFGTFLKKRRQEKNLTQKELAGLLYVTESAVSKWEKDVAHPDISLLPKLAEILGVSEHELITASIDKNSREEKVQAKKWRTLSLSWSLFFYISYALAIIPCFICDLAINQSLTWFWIVLSALLLAFTFTNLPKHIKKHKLIFVPLSMYSTLCLLLGVCCIYTNGNWFWVASLSVLLGLTIIFAPIFISKFKVFAKVKKYADFISVGIDFIVADKQFQLFYSSFSDPVSENPAFRKSVLNMEKRLSCRELCSFCHNRNRKPSGSVMVLRNCLEYMRASKTLI